MNRGRLVRTHPAAYAERVVSDTVERLLGDPTSTRMLEKALRDDKDGFKPTLPFYDDLPHDWSDER